MRAKAARRAGQPPKKQTGARRVKRKALTVESGSPGQSCSPPQEALNVDSAFFSSAKLQQDFQRAQPFRHVVVNDFLGRDFAAQLRLELIHKLDVKYRETDLFKFHQTKDISSLLALVQDPPRLPYLAKLVERIYSKEFRAELSQKFQLGTLADRVDMAAQAYTEGCHLLCHDDVISTRKLTFVLYLADPDEEPWKAEEGGGMEMYSEASPIPTLEILPDFNVALFFAVEPGKSFHAVREVVGERTRLSLQGWFHAPCLEETFGFQRRAEASLQQVLLRAPAPVPLPVELEGCGAAAGAALSLEEAQAALRPWVHPQYLEPSVLQRLQAHFAEHSEVQLSDFLLPEHAERLLRLLRAADAAEDASSYETGCASGWQLHGPPHLHRFLAFEPCFQCPAEKAARFAEAEQPRTAAARAAEAAPPAGASAEGPRPGGADACPHGELGAALSALRRELLLAGGLRTLLERVTNLRLVGCEEAQVRRFRRGLDYSIATLRGLRAEPRIDVCFMVAENGGSSGSTARPCIGASRAAGGDGRAAALQRRGSSNRGVKRRRSGIQRAAAASAARDRGQQVWQSEEVGGFESYIEVDEEEDDEKAEVYRDNDEEGPLLNIPAAHNALSIVMRDAGTLSFVKFVSHAAPSSRCDVKLVFGIDPTSLASDSEE